MHAKDVRPEVLARVHSKRRSFLDAVVDRAFTVPGDGCIDFGASLSPLAEVIVEAEHDPARAHPLTNARIGYAHLRSAAEKVGFVVKPA